MSTTPARGTAPGAYHHAAVGLAYDALNAAIWLPGGSRRLRRHLIQLLDPQPGEGVLELGCGTGQVTAQLVETGAVVTAVDRSEPMLARARRRAPGARIITQDLLTWQPDERYDAVVTAFLLHELTAPLRRSVLDLAASALADGGRLGILEWGCPTGRLHRAAWRTFVRTLEPPPALEVLDGALHDELDAAGWVITTRRAVAGGRAEVLVARRT